ncbi:alcohol dehydrogenase [Calycina marina]|uniref:Alcohol dehydrogenase n=1 Tax=Calycina marina TaxID=1763456 RepID=A0A9P7YXC4_9HELO|nr:alcohol dehydrogenase [Calycina marina]
MSTAGNLPSTIRTLSQPDPKKPELILTTSALPVAKSADEHLIRVHATSPCAGELLWPANDPEFFGDELVPCYDLSGTVIQAPKRSPFIVGTEIWGSTAFSRPGNAREYTIATTEELAVRPASIDKNVAATVPLSAVTAIQALFQHGGIADFDADAEDKKNNATKRIIIIAASGGVGIWALQIAREVGIGGIVAVCGTSNTDFVRSLGATEVIDYRKQTVKEWVDEGGEKVDLVLDLKGGKSLEEAWSAVKDGGMVVSIVEDPKPGKPSDLIGTNDTKTDFFIMTPKGSDLKVVSRLFEEGKVETFADSIWSLEDYKEAFAKFGDGHTRGKVIITP